MMIAEKSDEQQSHNPPHLKEQQISFFGSWKVIYIMEKELHLLVN